jgi:hypothetical protein
MRRTIAVGDLGTLIWEAFGPGRRAVDLTRLAAGARASTASFWTTA